jgi:phosphoglycolate phosphatase-like HAD superfamily hydrolase
MPNGDKLAVLFDLDETLVLSSALESLRRARDWSKVYAAFGMTSLPLGTVEALNALGKSNLTLGVITKSPRTYAERLIKHHALEIPVLVAYHDVKFRKPHPEALLKGCESIGIRPANCIYVGDHADDIAAARAAGCIPLGVNWGSDTSTLDVNPVCISWEEILTEVRRISSRGLVNE